MIISIRQRERSMSNNTPSTDDTIQFIRTYIIARYLYLIVFCLGIIGNIFNLMVFCRKKFYSNSCSIYFIAYSINNFMNLTVGLLLWSLTLGFNMSLEGTDLTYCRVRRYFTHVNFLLSSCLLTMASINRYARVRQAQLTKNLHRYIVLCQRRTSYFITILTILFCLVVNIHILFIFSIEERECYARSGPSRIFFDVFFLVFYAICPPLLMLAVNIVTLREIRSIRRLVHPSISRREYNLILLVILHSVSNACLTLPFTVNKFIYYTFDDLQSEKSQLIACITLLVAFMNPGLSFFLYTLTTRSFRHEFRRACKELVKKRPLLGCRDASNAHDNADDRDDQSGPPRHTTTGSILSLPMISLQKKMTSIRAREAPSNTRSNLSCRH